MSVDYQDFGRRVRAARKKKGMSLRELEAVTGFSDTLLGDIERGASRASLEVLVVLCNTLEVDPMYLLQGSLTNAPGSYRMPRELTQKERELVATLLHQARETVGIQDD